MRRTPALGVAMLFAGLAALPASGQDGGREADAAVRLSLEIAPAEKEVRLGERILLRVTLKNESPVRAVPVHPLRLGSPDSLSFRVKEHGRVHQVAKLFGSWEGNRLKPADAPWEQLKAGARMDETVELLALLPGELEISAMYRGVSPRERKEPVSSDPVKVTVKPGPKGERRVGARIRTDKGDMVAALRPEEAWNTVHNFLMLGSAGFYNDLKFHRVVEGFMVQTGDPNGDGSGDPGYFIPAETNALRHEKGVLSMARRGNLPNSSGSQFFIMHGRNAGLDWEYNAFGKVVEGMEVVDTLATVPTRYPEGGPRTEKSVPEVPPRLRGVEMVLLPGKE